MSSPPHHFPRPTEFAQALVAERLAWGDVAVDATVGNGIDTLFLAECVGPEGAVHGFDIQEEAIATAREKLAGLPQVSLYLAGHERLGDFVEGELGAVMFNLGYLPTGDKSIVTRPETTLSAFREGLDRLSPRGILTVVVYPGHDGGLREAAAVDDWLDRLDRDKFRGIRYSVFHRNRLAPYLVAVERAH